MIKFETDGRWYEWVGGFGAIIRSYERGPQRGDMRFIKGNLMYVSCEYRRGPFRRYEVCWSVPDPTIKVLDSLRKQFLG